jgi:monoamine oxidase
MVDNDVIVVGAGVAGLGAARALSDAGFDVLICEAHSRIGGRVQSLRRSREHVIELGAEFIHGDTVSTWQLVRQLTLSTSIDARWDGRMVWDGQQLQRMTHLVPHDPQLRALLTIEDALLDYSGPDMSFGLRVTGTQV